MPTILYINAVGKISGAERSLLAMLDALDRTQWCPVVAAPEGALLAEAAARGVPTHPLPLALIHRPRALADLWAAPAALRAGWRAVAGAVEKAQPDLIHANTAHAMLFALRQAPQRPVIWHARDLAGGPWARWLYRRATRVAVISAAVARSLRHYGDPAKLVHVAPAVDTAHFRPAEDRAARRAALGLPGEAPLIGLIAQFVPWKRHHLLLDALELLADRPWQAVLAGADLHGDVAYLESIRQRLATPSLAGRVSLLGWQADPAPLMSALDIVALTSRHEPFGRALIEAMACGVPAVAVDEDGPGEIVRPGVTGLLVPDDAVTFAEALANLLDDPARRHALGAAARADVDARFSLARQRAALAALYAECLAIAL